MNLVLTSPPASEPVTLAEAKLHLRVDFSDDDALIGSLITAARQWCEQSSGAAFFTQTWRLTLDDWPTDGVVKLPRPPVKSVTSVKYYDGSGTQRTLVANTDYQIDLDAAPARVAPSPDKSWPDVQAGRLSPIEIVYVAGETTTGAIDQRAKQAILLMVAHWYKNRESTITGAVSKEIELAVTNLMYQLWHGEMF